MKHEGVNDSRGLALARASVGNMTPVSESWRFGRPAAYNTIQTVNMLQAFLGSYSININTTYNIQNKTYELHFRVENVSGWASGTRFRKDVDGNKVHDSIIQDKVRGTGVHIGGNLKEIWEWTETVPESTINMIGGMFK